MTAGRTDSWFRLEDRQTESERDRQAETGRDKEKETETDRQTGPSEDNYDHIGAEQTVPSSSACSHSNFNLTQKTHQESIGEPVKNQTDTHNR